MVKGPTRSQSTRPCRRPLYRRTISMKRWVVAAAVTVACVGVAAPAHAEPPPTDKNVELWECEPADNPPFPEGELPSFILMTHAGKSRVFWIGRRYKMVSWVAVPPNANPGVKTWGGGKDLDDPDAIRCFLPGAEVV